MEYCSKEKREREREDGLSHLQQHEWNQRMILSKVSQERQIPDDFNYMRNTKRRRNKAKEQTKSNQNKLLNFEEKEDAW